MYMYKGGDYVYIYIHLAHNDTDFRQIFSSIYVYIYIHITTHKEVGGLLQLSGMIYGSQINVHQ